MAKAKQNEQSGTDTVNVLRVGRDVGIPVVAAEVEIKSLPGMTSKEAKPIAEKFLKDENGGWRFADVRYLPAGWGDVAEIADRDGLHKAIDRIYDTYVALQSSDEVELPARDDDGNILPDTEGPRFPVKFSVQDKDGNWVEQPVAGGFANYPENCDRIAFCILECFQYGAKLLNVQKNLRLVKLDEAVAAAKKADIMKAADGTSRKTRARNVI